jgi:hypothetical protein
MFPPPACWTAGLMPVFKPASETNGPSVPFLFRGMKSQLKSAGRTSRGTSVARGETSR